MLTMPQLVYTCMVILLLFRINLGDDMKEGDVRIIGRTNIWKKRIGGAVHVFSSGAWGSLDRHRVYDKTAEVVCRQLGYKTIRKYT